MIEVSIRPAREEDAPAIAEIYNHAVRTSTATFDTEEKSVEDRLRWLAEHGERYPVIVAVHQEKVIGWGSLSRYAERPGWRFTAENAVYVDPEFSGRGVGKIILEELIDLARKLGYHTIIAQIAGGNEASIRLHEKYGFKHAGTLKEAGNKFDRWIDVVLMEKVMSEEQVER